MSATLHYLFDPLCGWCYGVAPAIAGVVASGARVVLLPTGMFAGDGARPMDDAFAAYAWSNDQRIERLTGQRFSDHYRQRVLADRQQRFDSGPATVALTAVMLTQPDQEFEALKAIQHARYVEGHDVTSLALLAELLARVGLKDAATRTVKPDAELLAANAHRLQHARGLMHEFAARGVPALIGESADRRWKIDHSEAYSNPAALFAHLQGA